MTVTAPEQGPGQLPSNSFHLDAAEGNVAGKRKFRGVFAGKAGGDVN